MQRYKRCAIRVNKDKVNRYVKFKYGTIEKFCKIIGYSRVRYWQVLNKPHLSKSEKCLQDLASKIDLSIEEILL